MELFHNWIGLKKHLAGILVLSSYYCYIIVSNKIIIQNVVLIILSDIDHENFLSCLYIDLEHTDDDFNRKYVGQKLEHGRVRLWQEIQLKVRTFLLAVDLSNFKFNEFTQILNLVNK